MITNWQRQGSRQVYENLWIRLIEYAVVRPDGTEGIYSVVETKAQAVSIVAIGEDDRICLIHEYRFPVDELLWRLPMGGAGHASATCVESAKAELLEETGLTARCWSHVGQTVTMSGLSPEIAHVYLATKTSGSPDDRTDTDVRDVAFFSVAELSKMIRAGVLRDGQSLSALTVAFTSAFLA